MFGELKKIESCLVFSMVNPKDKTTDTLTVRALHDKLESLVFAFQQELTNYYKCEFVGDRTRLIDQIASIGEAGVLFTLKIQTTREC